MNEFNLMIWLSYINNSSHVINDCFLSNTDGWLDDILIVVTQKENYLDLYCPLVAKFSTCTVTGVQTRSYFCTLSAI